MRARTAILLVGLFTGSISASELSDPFPVRDPFPLRLLFLDQSPSAAAMQDSARARFAVNAAYVNTMVATDSLVNAYNRDESLDGVVTLPVLQAVAASEPSGTAYIVDAETLRLTFDARLRVSKTLEFAVEAPFLSQGHGFMDPFIDNFHSRFHLPDGGRTGFARNRYRAGYIGDGAEVYVDRSTSGLRPGDVVLTTTVLLLGADRHGTLLSLTLAGKLPTGDYRALQGSGSFDYGGRLNLSRTWRRSTVHLGYAYNVLGEWRLAPTLPLDDLHSLFGAYGFAVTSSTSLIVQVLRTSGPFPFRSGNDLGKASMLINAGFRHRLPRGAEFAWSFIENLDPWYNTPDIGGSFGITWRTGGVAPQATGEDIRPPSR